jgi:mannitol-1-phosphate 5-dehydrogenase
MNVLRLALIEEAGAALIQKYGGIDPLFTKMGFRHSANDLLERMMNPHLKDTVERVGRDPERKLGWNDRLIGAMRLVLSQGIKPVRFALGAAAAVTVLDKTVLDDTSMIPARLDSIWADASPDPSERQAVLEQLQLACHHLELWRKNGFRNLDNIL